MIASPFSLKGKTALLTGGGRGIGAAMSLGLRDAGARVAIFEYALPDELSEKIKYYKLDIGNITELENNFKEFIKDFEGIDILINNAAVTIPSPSEEYSKESWSKTLDINLSAVFYLCQLAGREMINQGRGGSIINITSIGAGQGFPNNPGYVATKGGVRQLSKALAYDWGKHGIRVNNLAPGYTHTPMNNKSWGDPELRKKRAEHTMLGRWAEPEDLIGPVVFLASDASRYVTGIDLYVDGGWIAKGI